MNPEEFPSLEATLKIHNEYYYSTNNEYCKVILDKISLLLELMSSLYIEKVNVDSWKIWCESVIYKLCFHTCSTLKLFQGTEIPFKNKEENLMIFDQSSVIILFRTIIENYLTFFYLYGSNCDEEAKKFRVLIWRYCGIKQRAEFDIETENGRQKQKEEIELYESLKKEILENKFFITYNNDERKKIIGGRKPRLFNSWGNLIEESNLNPQRFKNIYAFNSSYTHTEFISISQMQMGGYGYNEGSKGNLHTMLLIHGLICKTIMELKIFFPSMDIIFNSKETLLKEEIAALVRQISKK
jgi:hypothetical protein